MRGRHPLAGYGRHLAGVRKALIAAILCGLLYGAATGAGLPLMIKWVFPLIFGADAPALSTWQLVAVALWLPIIFTIRGAAGYFNAYLIQYVGVHVLESLRIDYFSKLQRLPLAFFQRHTTGDLIARGLNDTNQLQSALTVAANDSIKQPATLIGSLGYLVYLVITEAGTWIVLISLIAIAACVVPVYLIGRKLALKARGLQDQTGSLTTHLTENLAASKEVRSLVLESREIERFAAAGRALIRAQLKVAKYLQMHSPIIEVIAGIGISITFVYAYRIHIPLESFLSIITAIYVAYDPIKKLGALSNEVKRGTAALARLEGVLNEPESISDPVRPKEIGRLEGRISFRDVSFAYGDGKPVLSQVSVEIAAGTVCALVGPSGSGKSTFAALVSRFYDVTGGAVCVDGIDVRDLRVAELRRNIAVVSQDPVLFNDTIYNNLLLGRLDATPEEVERAARDAFAHEFILAQPQGYQTYVGERGGRLSGGQRQRIAIARAFLRAAPVLILDEATSALDAETETAVQSALSRLVVGRTVLIIAHRFSSIRDASTILVFNDKRIVASGDHANLYQSSPVYLWSAKISV